MSIERLSAFAGAFLWPSARTGGSTARPSPDQPSAADARMHHDDGGGCLLRCQLTHCVKQRAKARRRKALLDTGKLARLTVSDASSRGPDCVLRPAEIVKQGRAFLSLKYRKVALAHCPAIRQPLRLVRSAFASPPSFGTSHIVTKTVHIMLSLWQAALKQPRASILLRAVEAVKIPARAAHTKRVRVLSSKTISVKQLEKLRQQTVTQV